MNLERENARLRDRIAVLEDALVGTELLPVEWRLTPSEARVFGVMVNREVATKSAILAALYSDRPECDEADHKIILQFIMRSRKKVAAFGIVITTVWGRGYALSPDVRKRFRVTARAPRLMEAA